MPFQHKRLHEEPAPLSVVNPVYDEHAGDCESIELSNQGHSANNNVFKAPQSHTNGEVKLSIPETTSGPEHTSAEINATGDTHVQDVNSTNRVNDTAWHKGTEVPQPKLIQPAGHFGQHPLTRKIVVAVLAVILIVALALAGYFAYSLSTRQTKPSTTASPVISDQVHHQTNKTSKEYEFRLIGNDTGVGVLQVKGCKTWMYVCAEGWTSSSLVCQKLGYNRGDASLEVHTGYAELRAVKIGKLLNGPVDPCGRDVCMEVVGLRCVPLQRTHSNKGELIDNGNSSDTQTDVSMSTSVTQSSATDLKSTIPLAQSTAAHVPVSVLLPSATRTNAPASSPRTNVPTTRTNEPTPTPSTDVVTSTTTTNVTTSTAKTNVVGSSTRTEDIASTPSNDVITSAIRTNVPTSTTRTNIVASTTITNVQAPTSRTNVLASTTKTNVLVPSTRSMVLESTTTHTMAAPPPEINIRLVGMVAVNVGRLEVEYAGVWGTVCDDLWGETDAQVVCRQLGFDNYTEYKIFPHPREITAAQRDQAVVMSEVNCTGSEMNLSLCSYELWREEDAAKCGHNEDVVLSCLPHATTADPVPTTVPTTPSTTPTTTPTTTTTTSTTTTTTTTLPTTTAFSLLSDATAYIHPFKPEKPNKGLLVMQMNGTQYIMCDEDWSNKAAIVACRMTGYTEVLDKNDNFYDEDDKLLDDGEFMAQFVMLPSIVNCIGSETSLTECEFKTLTDNCLHYEAVLGLECGPAPTPPTTVPTTTAPTTTISTTPTTTPSTTPTTSTTTPSTTTPTLPAVTTPDPKPIKDRIPIRLVGGDGDYVGRLEVLYNDTWGTVCNSIWTESNADVVCRQLQYPDVAETEIFSQRDGLSRGSDDETIWLKEIQCEGSEQHLTNCQHEIYTNGDTSCGHNQDVLMRCAVDATVTSTEKPEYHANGDLRLNPGPHIGRLEYYYGNQWGAVCDEGWDLADAQVACHQLGFSNVSAFEASTDNDLPDIPFVISGTNCIANETRLSNCPQNRVNLTSCVGKETLSFWDGWSEYNERIVIACDPDSKINTTEPRDRIRLVNGLEDVNIGMLQYKKEGVWGKLCNKPSFTHENADLACRQLGFPGVLTHNLSVSSVIGIQLSAFSAPYHGKGYNCNDEDAEIAECSSLEVATDCADNKDEVAIECIPRSDQLEPSLADDSVRLVGGSSRFEGRVEVLINGNWGRVCDQGDWSDENMQYLCSHLFGDNYYTSDQLEIGEVASASGPFVAGGFNCTQQESLNEDAHFNLCSYNDSTEYLSLCDKDAVVRCIN